MPRELSPEEVTQLGLEPPRRGRELTPEEAASVGVTQPGPPPKREPSLGDGLTAMFKATQRGLTSDFADEGGALEQVALEGLSRALPSGVNDALGIESRYREPWNSDTALRDYRQARTENRADYKKTEASAPYGWTLAGNVIGGMLQPGGGGKKEAGGKVLKKALKRAGAQGALSGGIDGLGESEADLTTGDPSELLRAGVDVGLNSLFGAGFGAGGQLGGHYLKDPVKKLGKWLEKKASEKAASVLANNTGTMKGGREMVPREVGLEALEQGAFRVGGTMEGAADRLAEAKGAIGGKEYGPMIEKLSDTGVGTRVDHSRRALWEEGERAFEKTGKPEIRNMYRKWADNLGELVDWRMGSDVTLPIKQLETIKQTLQREADYGSIEDTLSNEHKKVIAGMLQRLNEQAVDEAGAKAAPKSEIAKLAKKFIPMKEQYGRLIEASKLAKDAAATNARKAPKPGAIAKSIDVLSKFAMRDAKAEMGSVAKKALMNAVNERLPSTLAAAPYLLSKATRKGAEKSGYYGKKLAGAAQRAVTPEVLDRPLDALWNLASSQGAPTSQVAEPARAPDAFWARFAPPPSSGVSIYETPEELKLRVLRETLQGYLD